MQWERLHVKEIVEQRHLHNRHLPQGDDGGYEQESFASFQVPPRASGLVGTSVEHVSHVGDDKCGENESSFLGGERVSLAQVQFYKLW